MDREIIDAWLKRYVHESMSETGDRDAIIKGCHVAHFDALGMTDLLSPYVGQIDRFIEFLTTEWNWRVTYDEAEGILIADENKDTCVCPLHREGFVTSGRLCQCSEGFAERMFGVVLGRRVTAEVVRSNIRDHQSCMYKISL